MPSLPAYLTRINYTGPIESTLDVLRAVHRQHLLFIPYEILDIHLGRELTLNLDSIFDKIVTRKRGGGIAIHHRRWCDRARHRIRG